MTPFISIIVLTLNSELYIERCLRSIERQDFTDFEVFIVDAGSTDGTEGIVKGYDSRFKWRLLLGSDMGTARNFGISLSVGKYVMFLDSDDFYLQGKVRTQIRALEDTDADVAFCAAWHFRTGRPGRFGLKSIVEPNLHNFMFGYNENLNTMCMRRSVWDAGYKFGEGDRGRYGEEWRLQLSMSVGGLKMRKTSAPLVVVELRPDSHTTWSRQRIMKREALDEVSRIYNRLSDVQRTELSLGNLEDAYRYKLVVALLLDNSKIEAAGVMWTMRSSRERRMAKVLMLFSSICPQRFLRNILTLIWEWRQNRTFSWSVPDQALEQELSVIFDPSCRKLNKQKP